MISRCGVFVLKSWVLLVLLGAWYLEADGRTPEEKTVAPISPQTSETEQSEVDSIVKGQSENDATRWYRAHDREAIRGVALVVHGLNLRPDKMRPIIYSLTMAGIEVLQLSLRGHGENYPHHEGVDDDQARMNAFKTVSFPLWINETYLAYTRVQNKAAQIRAPVFFVGFSLGGLIGLDLLASHQEVQYDRMVLFAPAIKLHGIHYLARILSPFSRLVIPSLAPDDYLSNQKGTPVAAYNALFEGLQQFESHASLKINIPTLIFIDEEDEFIPVGGIKELIKEKSLDLWKLDIVEKETTADKDTFHHHIIDEASTGKTVWNDMMESTIAWLLTTKPD